MRFPNGEYDEIVSGIISGSASLERTLCASSDLNFGECNASGFGIEISDIADISGLKIQAYVKIPGYENEVVIFTGYVNSAKMQPEHATRKIEAYDDLHHHADDNVSEWYDGMFTRSNKPEYKGVWSAAVRYVANDTVHYNGGYYRYFCGTSDQFLVTNSDEDGNEITTTYNAADYCIGKTPEQLLEDEHGCNYIEKLEVYNPYNYGSVTVKEFRDSLFAHVGIPQENVTLINDAVQITKTLESTELHFSDCVKAICQINAVFGHISETGVFQYIALQDSAEDFSGNYKATATTYEEFSTKRIDSVRLYGNSGDVMTVYGGGKNYWSISNNFLLYSLPEDVLVGIAKQLYNAVSGISYTPASLSALLSIFPVALGSRLTFTTHTGEQVASYVLKDILSGAQLTDQTVSAGGNEVRSTALSVTDTLGIIESRTNAIIEQVYEKITADSAEIKVVSGNLANYKTVVAEKIQAVDAEITNIRSTNITVENLEARVAELGYLSAETADLKYATVGELTAVNAEIDALRAGSITTDYLEAHYAAIDLANIAAGTIKTAMIDTGAIQSAQIADGSITDAKIVELTANKITAGTLSVERLEIRGSANSIVYALNNITGALQAQNVDTLNGEILTPRTITADKIVANSITGNEIAAKTITANNIVANSITGDEIQANTIDTIHMKADCITADKINITDLFAQDITATGTIRGANLVGATGSFSGSVTATDGYIGDLQITSGYLLGVNGNVQTIVGTDFISIGIPNNAHRFVASSDGTVNAYNIYANGLIDATGSITSAGNIKAASMTSTGSLTAASATVSGSLKAASMTVTGSLTAASVTLKTGGLQLPTHTGTSWANSPTFAKCIVATPHTNTSYYPIIRQDTKSGNIFTLGGFSTDNERFGIFGCKNGCPTGTYDYGAFLDVTNGTYYLVRCNVNVTEGDVRINGGLRVIEDLKADGSLTASGKIYTSDAIEVDGTVHLHNVYTYQSTEAANVRVGSTGRIARASSSSVRYKDLVSVLSTGDIEPLYDIPVHWFKYKEGYIGVEDERYRKTIPGFIVEDWEGVMPIAIDHNPDGSPEMWNNNIVVPLMFEMIKNEHRCNTEVRDSLQDCDRRIYTAEAWISSAEDRIDALRDQLAAARDEINALRARIAEQDALIAGLGAA
ncbi:hypothetical protein [Marvinbryantia sp.]|uniref:hypothetical protein n=1 Tax=Marvinbryantia sp. TaxID=2496532 RepID=UPI00260EDEB0|nr:hypothetical protein [uncultured Marvinbryantia sp.]